MISIKLSFKWCVHQLFLLTLIFDRMGRLGQIGSIQTPRKILTWSTETKNSAGGIFKSTHYQSRISKKMFLEGISQLSIIVWLTITHSLHDLWYKLARKSMLDIKLSTIGGNGGCSVITNETYNETRFNRCRICTRGAY